MSMQDPFGTYASGLIAEKELEELKQLPPQGIDGDVHRAVLLRMASSAREAQDLLLSQTKPSLMQDEREWWREQDFVTSNSFNDVLKMTGGMFRDTPGDSMTQRWKKANEDLRKVDESENFDPIEQIQLKVQIRKKCLNEFDPEKHVIPVSERPGAKHQDEYFNYQNPIDPNEPARPLGFKSSEAALAWYVAQPKAPDGSVIAWDGARSKPMILPVSESPEIQQVAKQKEYAMNQAAEIGKIAAQFMSLTTGEGNPPVFASKEEAIATAKGLFNMMPDTAPMHGGAPSNYPVAPVTPAGENPFDRPAGDIDSRLALMTNPDAWKKAEGEAPAPPNDPMTGGLWDAQFIIGDGRGNFRRGTGKELFGDGSKGLRNSEKASDIALRNFGEVSYTIDRTGRRTYDPLQLQLAKMLTEYEVSDLEYENTQASEKAKAIREGRDKYQSDSVDYFKALVGAGFLPQGGGYTPSELQQAVMDAESLGLRMPKLEDYLPTEVKNNPDVAAAARLGVLMGMMAGAAGSGPANQPAPASTPTVPAARPQASPFAAPAQPAGGQGAYPAQPPAGKGVPTPAAPVAAPAAVAPTAPAAAPPPTPPVVSPQAKSSAGTPSGTQGDPIPVTSRDHLVRLFRENKIEIGQYFVVNGNDVFRLHTDPSPHKQAPLSPSIGIFGPRPQDLK